MKATFGKCRAKILVISRAKFLVISLAKFLVTTNAGPNFWSRQMPGQIFGHDKCLAKFLVNVGPNFWSRQM